MEKASIMEKPIELAKSSQQFIEGLCRLAAEVSQFLSPITSIFSSFFDILANVIMHEVSFNRVVYELALTRFMFLSPYDLRMRRTAQPEEEYLPPDIGRTNISFLFNVTVARKIVADLSRRLAMQVPKSALFPALAPSPEPKRTEEAIEKTIEEPAETVFPIVAPLPETGAEGKAIEEPTKLVFHIVADLQRRLESKLAPSVKGMASALQEYGRQTFLLTPLLASPGPLLIEPTRLEGFPPQPLVTPAEKEIPHVSFPERPLAEISQVPPPYKEALVEPKPLDLTLRVRLSPEILRPFGFAARLPTIVSEQESPILKVAAALSRVSPPMLPSLGFEPSYRYPAPAASASAPMRPSQISRLLEEISPSLTSWIYGESEILRGTAVSLSAVPVAASTAQRIVTEALVQPISGSETPQTFSGEESVSPVLTTATREARFGQGGVEAFRLPAIVTSLVAASIQRYSLLFAEPAVAETYRAPFEMERVSPEESTVLGQMPEEKRYSRLPAVIALAAAESLIVKRLQHEFTAFVKEMQVARSTYGETLAGLGAAGPVRTTMLGELAAAPVFPSTIEPYAPRVPSGPPPSARSIPVASPTQNTVNLTISAESTEEDLRDLERKINRILSEQISRYYGSTRI
jgi:hypothetical protein